ncbi:MAG: hypothetical protein L3J18_03115 [Candidatus Brocadia sp.]|nr:MAG: hypothetical protein L3J18_03115 [Candidatus Brocadia sp.]
MKYPWKIQAYFFDFLDFPVFLTAGFLGICKGDGRQSISRFAASRPHESQMYFKLTSLGEHTCRGSPVVVPQYLQATTFFAGIGLQR